MYEIKLHAITLISLAVSQSVSESHFHSYIHIKSATSRNSFAVRLRIRDIH